MDKIKTKHQCKIDARNAEIKRLWKSLWYKGAKRTAIAEAIAENQLVNTSYSTVLRVIGK